MKQVKDPDVERFLYGLCSNDNYIGIMWLVLGGLINFEIDTEFQS